MHPRDTDIHVRKANEDEAGTLARLHEEAVTSLALDHYSPEQVAAWTASWSAEVLAQAIGLDAVWVALQAQPARDRDGPKEPMGFGVLAGSRLGGLCVARSAKGRGVGQALLSVMEAEARAWGADSLTLEAALGAVPFYEELGFTARGESVCSCSAGDHPLPCMEMVKQL